MVAIPSGFLAALGGLVGTLPTQPDGCELSKVALPLSSDKLAALGAPSTPLSAVTVGFGVQNYTCGTDSKFTSVGAVGQMFDISQLASTGSPLLQTVSQDLFNIWSAAPPEVTIQDVIAALPSQLPNVDFGQHYFPINNGVLTPVWDFRSIPRFQGNEEAVFDAKVLQVTPADDPNNVALVHLGKVKGNILDEIYRLYTVGGVPPATCTPGSTTSIKYTSHYWCFGGSLGL